MKKIRNAEQLLDKGDSSAREKVLYMLDEVLQEMDAGERIKKIMRLEGDKLSVGDRCWNLNEKNNIYLLGAGKACNAMAQAVCEILGDRISHGIIAVKIAEPDDKYLNTDVYVAGHPLPTEEGVLAAKAMIDLISTADKDDLFISVTSGGSSALLTFSVDGIPLQDEILAQDILLKSGANIYEINAVRRHTSRTNGGRLTELICNRLGAELISLVVSDGVGNPPQEILGEAGEYYGTPFAADNTTIQDARDTILNYDLTSKLPSSVVDYVMDDEKIRETPKKFGDKLTTFLIGSVNDTCDAAEKVAQKIDENILVLTTFLEGESKDAGYALAAIAKEVKVFNRPIAAPCYIVCSGETTTQIDEKPAGSGGPSHELVVSFSIGIDGYSGIAAASIDTEGTDGSTIYAGGLVDSKTYKNFESMGENPFQALRNHATGEALEAIGDNIFTGNTGTNLCDFNVIYIDK